MNTLILDSLPPVILRYIIHNLSDEDIKNLCNASIRINKGIRNSNNYWHDKFNKCFGSIVQNYQGKWMDLYYSNTSVLSPYCNDAFPELSNRILRQISDSGESVAVVDINNNVWVYGKNIDNSNLTTFTLIPSLKAKQIHIESWYMMVIDIDDNLLIFSGAMLKFPEVNKAKQISRNMILDIHNDIWYYSYNHSKFVKMEGIKGKFIASGPVLYNHHAIIDLEDNLLFFDSERNYRSYIYGQEIQEERPIKASDQKFKSASIGGLFTVAVDIDDNVWACGYNECGQLGLGDTVNRVFLEKIPEIKAEEVAAGYSHTLIRSREGNVFLVGCLRFGSDKNDFCLRPKKLEGIKCRYILSTINRSYITGITLNID